MSRREKLARLTRLVGRAAQFNCETCGYLYDGASGRREVNALYARARAHVRATGHRVHVEDTYFVSLSPPKLGPEAGAMDIRDVFRKRDAEGK